MYECEDKAVSHPSHYQSETGLEVIDVIQAFTFNLKGIEAVDTGNALKYLCRWKEKNGVQDLKKAVWYIIHLIDHIEKLEKENIRENCVAENDGPFKPYAPVFTFDTHGDMERFVNAIRDILEAYDCVSLADAYDLINMPSATVHAYYGWKSLDDMKFSSLNTYSIQMPMLEYIK